MVDTKFYPSIITEDIGTWTNPDEAKTDNAVCASITRNVPCRVGTSCPQLGASGFGLDSIPSDAIISAVYFGIDSSLESLYCTNTEPQMRITAYTSTQIVSGVICGSAKVCLDAIAKEDADVLGLTLNDLRTENFTVKLVFNIAIGSGGGTAYFDCCYIRVVYTVPAAQLLGDGLSWIAGIVRFALKPIIRLGNIKYWLRRR